MARVNTGFSLLDADRDLLIQQFLGIYRECLEPGASGDMAGQKMLPRVALVESDRNGNLVRLNQAAIELLRPACRGNMQRPLTECCPALAAAIWPSLQAPPCGAHEDPMPGLAAGEVTLALPRDPVRLCYFARSRPYGSGLVLAASPLPDPPALPAGAADSAELVRMRQALHDGPCNDLVALRLQVEQWQHALELPVGRLAGVQAWVDQLQNIEQALRGLIEDWPHRRVGAAGLAVALEYLVAGLQAAGGIDCVWRCERAIDVSDDEVAENLYLIAREAVINALRHSGGSQVTVTLGAGASNRLVIADDGGGLDFARDLACRRGGLSSMRRRARQIGVGLSFRRARPSGLVVDLTF
ncbi:MAG: sensor histidine kinase [Wenzhouxiangella sp.]